jgi:hypothetical protein
VSPALCFFQDSYLVYRRRRDSRRRSRRGVAWRAPDAAVEGTISRSRHAIARESLQNYSETRPRRSPKAEGSGAPKGAIVWCRACEARPRTLRSVRSPSGAPQRRLPERANAPAQSRPCFTPSGGSGGYPRRRSRLSGTLRAPVVMPAGTMPRPPGSRVTSPARRNRTRPIQRLSPVDVPEVSEIRYCNVAEAATIVNGNVTERALPCGGLLVRRQFHFP